MADCHICGGLPEDECQICGENTCHKHLRYAGDHVVCVQCMDEYESEHPDYG